MLIESKQNKQYKRWIKLKTKKYRDTYDMFLVYGRHLIDHAKAADACMDVVTSNPDKEGIQISRALMKNLQVTPSWIDEIGVCKKTNQPISSNRILMLDDVQDPQNVGALLRSAAAFGFNHVILSPHCADLYNEKTIRASKGAIFNCYVERKPLPYAIQDFKTKGFRIIAADAHASKSENIQNDQLVLILGNEGHGLSDDILSLIDQSVTIETKHVESLNVSVAGSILMYTWRDLT